MGHTPYLPPHLHIYRGAAAHLGGVLDTPSGFLFPSLFRCLMLLPSFFHLELIPSLCFRLQDVGGESSIMNKHVILFILYYSNIKQKFFSYRIYLF